MIRGILLITFIINCVGCAELMGKLRKDLDDSAPYSEPTVGGVWPEAGMLRDPGAGSEFAAVGHNERGLASLDGAASSLRNGDRRSWIDPEEGLPPPPSYGEMPNLPPQVSRDYKNGARATRADFIDESQNEGSLWASNGQTNYFFTKNRVRGVGDILNIKIEDKMLKDMAVEVKKTLTQPEMQFELAQAQRTIAGEAVASAAAGAGKAAAPAPAKEKPAEESTDAPAVRDATPNDVDLTPSLGVAAGDSMMCEILERYPNGNYKIRGVKRVPYRGTTRLMTLVGVARSADIDDTDSVASGKLYEYRLKTYH